MTKRAKSEVIIYQGEEYRATDCQMNFARNYALTGDAAQSYMDAFGLESRANAYKRAIRLLEKDDTQGFVAHFKDSQRQRMDIRDDRILAEYASMAFSNVANLYDENGNAIPIRELPEHAQRAIKKVKVSQIKQKKFEDADGQEVILESSVLEIELHDKQKSLDRIAEIQGLISNEDRALPPAEIKITVTESEVKVDRS